MKESAEQRYCKNCKKETTHKFREDALEIECICTECNKQEDIVKTFF